MVTAAYVLLIYVIGWWLAAIVVKWCFKTNTLYNFFHCSWSGQPDILSIWTVIFFWPFMLIFIFFLPVLMLIGWVADKLIIFLTK
ncbi:hypothetical protein PQC43_gp104 [Escherichia phage vB_EcoP-101114UKE3]|uniref:Transmembrane protein n=1 Tax=Escherichia phage vB_EcoP-101114UKE3 TaxID=2865794 RepID=A0AAE8C4J1_9CAUD|nr:hypothetical protein PQC43_gp104 [Escherichia phage vB_EcoP-101114UKE3]QZI79235.1 hypothetical protein 101114UKE3_104 [Escherichia phage vB_EcoP-101114UKE3]USM81208.1 hypothetical protein 101114BS3_081 [Escherichia phage vB_EcoP-101114BS3]